MLPGSYVFWIGHRSFAVYAICRAPRTSRLPNHTYGPVDSCFDGDLIKISPLVAADGSMEGVNVLLRRVAGQLLN